jgi:hypothetical protein
MKNITQLGNRLWHGMLALFLVFLFNSNGWGQIISQYIETNSGSIPKGLEIWNNTASTLDFSTNNLVIQQGTNGDALSDISNTTISSGTLAPNAVLVIGTSDLGTYLTDQGLSSVLYSSNTFTFNGDDALAVKYGGSITDIFGTPGSDPGTSWTGGSVSTANQNISLLSGITSGDLVGWTDPSLRFSTISTTPVSDMSGFGIAPDPGSSDTDAPIWTATYPSTANITSTGFDVMVNLDEIGTAYYVVVADGATAPTSAQVKAGTDVSDVAALADGSIAVLAATTEYTATINTLAANTAYDVYVVAEDDEASPNLMASPSPLNVTTSASLSTETDFTAFSLAEQTGAATINATAHTIGIEVPFATDRNALIATFELSAGAEAAIWATPQESGVTANDFSSTVTYTVTAQDGTTTQDWDVSVSLAPASTDATLNDLLVDGTTVAGFDAATLGYGVELDYSTTVVPTVTYVVNDATATASQTDAAALPGSTTVEVTAQSGDKTTYTINFTLAAPSADATVSSSVYTVDNGLETISGLVYQEKLDLFESNLTPATGATFVTYEADGIKVATDLKDGYKLIVTAQNETTSKTYTIVKNAEPALDLFFSEYIEGSSNNKALEIYNPTQNDIDLTLYKVKLAGNGGAWGNEIALEGTLAPGHVYIVYNSSAAAEITSIGNIISNVTYYNGDDALGLFKSDVLIDAIGLQGEDPGTAWDVAAVSNATIEHTLVRKPEVNYGNTSWYSAAGTTADNSEWVVYDQDEFSYLGSHTVSDIIAPTVSFSPADGATQVSTTVNPVLTFGEEIFNATDGSAIANGDLTAKLSLFETATPANTVALTASIIGNEVTVIPSVALTFSTQYTLNLLANTLEDASGNENELASASFTIRNASTDATISSLVYTVNNTDNTIVGVPISDDLAAFKTNITPAVNATFEVYESDATTVATNLANGYKLICTAEDLSTSKTYTISKNTFVNTEANILTFVLAAQTADAVINSTDHTVALEVPYGTNLTNLVPTFTLSAGADAKIGTIAQESGVTANDFSTMVTYTITAEDGITSLDWKVTVSEEAPASDATLSDLLIDNVSVEGFDAAVYSYSKEYPYGTTTIPAVSYILNNATASAVQNDATSMPGTTSVVVTAQDGTTELTYSIEFTWAAASTEAFVTSTVYTVNDTDESITDIPFGTALATFKANLTPANNATFEVYQADGTTLASDLQTGFKVIATAQDGITIKTYTITLDEQAATDLFFTEYIEGSSNNKAIEIYNPTGVDVDLSAYTLKASNNGLGWGITSTGEDARYSLNLTGTIAAGDVYVLYNGAATATEILAAGDLALSYSNTANEPEGANILSFNGNDALGLFKNDVLIDVFGYVDGTENFDVAGIAGAAKDHTLVRIAEVSKGNTDWASAAGTDADNSEWIVYDIDVFTYLGSHEQGADTEAPIATFDPTKDATNVLVTVNPILTFNETVYAADGSAFTDGADVSTLLEMYETATPTNTVTFAATITGELITVVPAAPLTYGMQYTLVLKADVLEDKAGNQNMMAQSAFTTIDANTPVVELTYPTGGETFYTGSEVTVTWNAANVANLAIEVYIAADNAWIPIVSSTDATDGSEVVSVDANAAYSAAYKLRISDVTNAEVSDSSAVFEIIPVVETLAAVREQGVGAKVKFIGDATVTMVQSYRSQKFIQDASAAILIDDFAGTISSVYAIGDNITALEGSLSEYGDMLQFVPTADPGATSGAGTVIDAQVISLSEFTSNFETYEAELISFEQVQFTAADETIVFESGTSYEVSDQTNTANFYTNFYDADYIDATIPKTVGTIAGVAFSRTTGVFFAARDAADMVFTTDPKYTVTFNVFDEDGNAVADAYVAFNSQNILTSSEGIALFTDVDPVTDAAFTVIKSDQYQEYNGTVTVTDQDISVDVVLIFVGIDEQNELVQNIYPNPSKGAFTVLLSQISENTNLTITDMNGKVVHKTNLSAIESKVDISNLEKGVYFVQIMSDKAIYSGSIILSE